MHNQQYQRCSPFSGPQFFRVEQCQACMVSKIVPHGKVWGHQCSDEALFLANPK